MNTETDLASDALFWPKALLSLPIPPYTRSSNQGQTRVVEEQEGQTIQGRDRSEKQEGALQCWST